jgi:hypothetical protein
MAFDLNGLMWSLVIDNDYAELCDDRVEFCC